MNPVSPIITIETNAVPTTAIDQYRLGIVERISGIFQEVIMLSADEDHAEANDHLNGLLAAVSQAASTAEMDTIWNGVSDWFNEEADRIIAQTALPPIQEITVK
jgi:hypothetical protein